MGEPSAPVGSFGKRRRRRSSRLVGGGGRGDSRVRPEERERKRNREIASDGRNWSVSDIDSISTIF
jgi:hypothetical protein